MQNAMRPPVATPRAAFFGYGEIESFAPTVSLHGPAFVATVLEQRDLGADPELESARVYVRRLLGIL